MACPVLTAAGPPAGKGVGRAARCADERSGRRAALVGPRGTRPAGRRRRPPPRRRLLPALGPGPPGELRGHPAGTGPPVGEGERRGRDPRVRRPGQVGPDGRGPARVQRHDGELGGAAGRLPAGPVPGREPVGAVSGLRFVGHVQRRLQAARQAGRPHDPGQAEGERPAPPGVRPVRAVPGGAVQPGAERQGVPRVRQSRPAGVLGGRVAPVRAGAATARRAAAAGPGAAAGPAEGHPEPAGDTDAGRGRPGGHGPPDLPRLHRGRPGPAGDRRRPEPGRRRVRPAAAGGRRPRCGGS